MTIQGYPPALRLYENARVSLAELHRVDEVKNIRDKAIALELYAKQAKDMDLIDKAIEIKLRAEIRAGELLREMGERGERQTVGANQHGGSSSEELPPLPTLADLGVTKKQSHQWQKLAALPENEREAVIAQAKAPKIRTPTAPPPPRANKVEAVAQVIKEETGQWPSTKKLAEVAGIGPRNADNALRTVKAVEAAVKTLPELKYTKAQENHVEARAKVLELTFEQRVQEQVNALFEQALAQRDKYDAELIEQALAVMEFDRKHRSRPFTAGEYTGVLMRALHPDTTTPENRMEAFKLVNNRKLLLRDEGRIKLRGSLAAQLPKTPAEWAAAKRTAAEARKHK